MPEPLPEATPEQLKLADDALEVLQLKVLEAPVPTRLELKLDEALGAAYDVKLAELDVDPPAFEAVKVQLPTPVEAARTLKEPLVPDALPEAAPEQETEPPVAPLEDQLNVTYPPAVTAVDAKELDAPGAGTMTFKLAAAVATAPAAFRAEILQ